jgi:uncharacterized protein DUF4386
MNSTKKTARLAGLLWLLATVTGGFGLSYIRSKVIVPEDAAATVANIMASELAYRAAIVGILVSQTFMFFFGLTLFRMFKDVNEVLARVFLISIMMSVGIAIVNTLNHFEALLILGQPAYLKVFNPDQLKAMALTSLRLANGSGQGLLEVFWAPFYFSFGLLINRSRFLPRVLGVLLMMMGVGFATNILEKFLIPQFHPVLFTGLAISLGALGGIPTILWLLIVGAKVPPAISEH